MLTITKCIQPAWLCSQVYPGQPASASYAMSSTAVQGYTVPMEQLPAGAQLPGQPAPRSASLGWLSAPWQHSMKQQYYNVPVPIGSFVMPACLFHSDVHMYMGQPPVYPAAPGSMAPADVQSYQNQGPAPAPAPGTTHAGMAQTASYAAPSGTSLAPSSDASQVAYSEKALL